MLLWAALATSRKTKAEKQHLERVANLGCIVCRNLGIDPEVPASIHHKLLGMGMGQRASHYDVMPLCYLHHQGGGHGIAIHAGMKTWIKKYGTEEKLIEQTKELLDERRVADSTRKPHQ